ncbi:MAG: hypothetical protein J1F36_05425 [Clostridiales bacterium]|nr:hypothetical protein [Clostridiales bacterium]
MKRIFLIICLLVAAITLLSCNNPEAKSGEATVYGVTGACPVSVKVKVDGDGKVLEAEFNEYLSVYDIGKVDNNGKKYGVEIAEVENGYAKYVKVGDKTFVCEEGIYTCDEIMGTDKTFDGYMAGDGGRWYISQVREGNFDIVDRSGNSYGVPFTEYDDYKLDKNIWADKMKNGYHEGVEYDSGWKENIYSLVTHIKNHGFYEYTGEEKPSGNKNTYKIGKYDTLVDLENFHDYMQLAQKAYNEAKEQVKNS